MQTSQSSAENSHRSLSRPELATPPDRRVFDCALYNGEIDLLELRLEELDAHVDIFVVVEATKSFTGKKKARTLLDDWGRIRKFAPKLRYVALRGFAGASGPWERETFQRNSCLDALLDGNANSDRHSHHLRSALDNSMSTPYAMWPSVLGVPPSGRTIALATGRTRSPRGRAAE
jgi:hypothetical protein